jgi:hypothetical protein
MLSIYNDIKNERGFNIYTSRLLTYTVSPVKSMLCLFSQMGVYRHLTTVIKDSKIFSLNILLSNFPFADLSCETQIPEPVFLLMQK